MVDSMGSASPTEKAQELERVPELPLVTDGPADCGEGHRRFAALYDRLSAPLERRYTGRVREELVGAASGRVLEVGAGTGLNFRYYEPARATRVVATEPDPFMLRQAEQRAAQRADLIRVVRAPAEQIGLSMRLFLDAAHFDPPAHHVLDDLR